jgi:hypothetical protein
VTRLWPLISLVCAGLVIELCWLVLTPLSFRMTHGAEYTQTLLLEHPLLAGWLDGLVPLAVRLAPAAQQQSTYIDPQLNTLAAIFVVTSLAYLAAVVLLDRLAVQSRLEVALVVGFALLFQLSLLPMPGFLTTDAFSYVMYGRISFIYRLNPYLVPPGAFPNDPLLGWIHPSWVMQPSVYGPLWTDLGWLMAKLGASVSLVDQVFSYKLLMNLAQVVNLGLVWLLLGRILPGQRLTAFALFAWNPLVLFEFAGNAHNDGFMLTWLLAGLVPLAVDGGQARWAWGAGLVWLSALVKFTSGVVALFFVVAWLRGLPVKRRVASAFGLVVACGVLSLVVSQRWLPGPGALQPLVAYASGSIYGNSLVDLLGTLLGGPDLEQGRFWAKLLTRLVFLGYLAWEVRQVWRAAGQGVDPAVQAVLTASVRALLAVLLLVLTWVLTWYFTWPLALAIFLGWRSTLTRVVVACSLTCLPSIYLKHYWGDAMPDALALLYLLPILLVPAATWLLAHKAYSAPTLGHPVAVHEHGGQ